MDDDYDGEDGPEEYETCGRWDNGRLMDWCSLAGSEDCDFCPLRTAACMENIYEHSGDQ